MYLFPRATFLVLLLHQCIVNGFNIFDMDIGFNFKKDVNSLSTSLAPDEDKMTRWILQELDHFNSNDNRTWLMKYFEGLKYWKNNGPIYLFLSGQHPADYIWAREGLMKELAQETDGAMYILEHRYYGESKPFMNLDTENIKYLSSRQALADIAKLISYLKSLPMYSDSKVVAIGGVYGGNLATWMKVLYPNLIDAAVSSSAPVLAQKDYFEYLENYKEFLEVLGGKECLDETAKNVEKYNSLLQSPEGILQLKKEFYICDSSDMTVLENQELFFFFLTWLNYLKPCVPFRNNKNVKSLFLNGYSNSYDCRSFSFQETINYIKDKRNLFSVYTMLYQSCTEFGQFLTTSSKDQPFLNVPLEFYIKICSALFGNNFSEKRLDEGIEITNKMYGGLKPNVTKVVFTNGALDPWRTIGVLEDVSPDAQAVVIPGEQYGAQDLFKVSIYDSEELQEAQDFVKYLIKKWIRAG